MLEDEKADFCCLREESGAISLFFLERRVDPGDLIYQDTPEKKGRRRSGRLSVFPWSFLEINEERTS